MSDARSKYADLVAKHRAAGHTVHEPTQDDPVCYVEMVRDGRRYGPDGIKLRWPLTDTNYAQMADYLDLVYEGGMDPALRWMLR